MVWSRLRRGRTAAPRLPLPGPCWRRRHTLRTERLLLYTPETRLDLTAAVAAGSDPAAQRWLAWNDERVIADAGVREGLLRLRPGDAETMRASRLFTNLLNRPYEPDPDEAVLLIGVRADTGTYAGVVMMHPGTGEIDGWTAPEARGLGLGTEMFRAAVVLGHAHLGLPTVLAGLEPANTACARALAKAGFVAAEGPPRHTHPNGSEVDARWLRHTVTAPLTRCPGAAPLPA
ncbi:GNAT family N-acetyltransferase [Streptomyces sp. NPDC008092]|uniref:GNAT family N-acetyltransferase n=1 Tax=Streptomyces sp. NPDC008092 TaxID=3364808 RepID=UPI0036EE9754